MIFQYTFDKVLSGEQTQTRRLVKRYEYFDEVWGYKNATVHREGGRVRWQVNQKYVVQPGRGCKGQGTIRITAIRREDVRDISWSDALAEGYESPEEFLEDWVKMHDKVAYNVLEDLLNDRRGGEGNH